MKVNAVLSIVPSVASELLTLITTSSVGCMLSTTVNSDVAPSSLVSKPAVGVTVIPGSAVVEQTVILSKPNSSLEKLPETSFPVHLKNKQSPLLSAKPFIVVD